MLQNRSQKLMEFLERSGPSLYALLTRLTLYEDVAEDLMQELFMKLSNSKALEKVENWDAYARRCAINLAFDWRQTKMPTVALNEVHEPALNDNSPLSGLSRETFVMRHIQQDSYEQVAKEVGKEPHQVRALCSKAMTQLRRLLSNNKSPFSGKEQCDA